VMSVALFLSPTGVRLFRSYEYKYSYKATLGASLWR
jgi:hypothetical protein